MKTPARGAATSIYLASAPGLEQVSGRYFASSKPRKSAGRSYDETVAGELWQISADLTAPPQAQAAAIKPRGRPAP
jgi:retinol dehydrogenase-14